MEQDNEKSIQSLVMEISRMYMEKCFVKLKKVGIIQGRSLFWLFFTGGMAAAKKSLRRS